MHQRQVPKISLLSFYAFFGQLYNHFIIAIRIAFVVSLGLVAYFEHSLGQPFIDHEAGLVKLYSGTLWILAFDFCLTFARNAIREGKSPPSKRG